MKQAMVLLTAVFCGWSRVIAAAPRSTCPDRARRRNCRFMKLSRVVTISSKRMYL
jgi:hypothetical protein